MAGTKPENDIHIDRLELANTEETPKPALTRTQADELSTWQSLRQNKLLALVAMAAAFSASLEGYRKAPSPSYCTIGTDGVWCVEINLNGGLVSNKGFIRQMASPGTTIIKGKYVSAWGGIQSAGQTVGQIVSWIAQYV